jgi:hypothetical protein
MTDDYGDAYDWSDMEIFDYADFLSREEMEAYLEDNFDHIDNPVFWDTIEGLLNDRYGDTEYD